MSWKTLLLCASATLLVTTLGCAPPPVSVELSGVLADDDERLTDDQTLFDVHRFEARRGDTISVSLTSDDFDAYLFLLDPRGDVVAFDDDSGEDANSLIDHRATASGQYVVIANAYAAGSGGDYVLTIETSR